MYIVGEKPDPIDFFFKTFFNLILHKCALHPSGFLFCQIAVCYSSLRIFFVECKNVHFDASFLKLSTNIQKGSLALKKKAKKLFVDCLRSHETVYHHSIFLSHISCNVDCRYLINQKILIQISVYLTETEFWRRIGSCK